MNQCVSSSTLDYSKVDDTNRGCTIQTTIVKQNNGNNVNDCARPAITRSSLRNKRSISSTTESSSSSSTTTSSSIPFVPTRFNSNDNKSANRKDNSNMNTRRNKSCISGGTTTSPGNHSRSRTATIAAVIRKTTKILKHKRRYCREDGCGRIVKSQGLCQRHGAKPKKCRVNGCIKQAQGSYNGMCKSHFRSNKGIVPMSTYSSSFPSPCYCPSTTTSMVTTPVSPTNVPYCCIVTPPGTATTEPTETITADSTTSISFDYDFSNDVNEEEEEETVTPLTLDIHSSDADMNSQKKKEDEDVDEVLLSVGNSNREFVPIKDVEEPIVRFHNYQVQGQEELPLGNAASLSPWIVSPYSSGRVVHWDDDVIVSSNNNSSISNNNYTAPPSTTSSSGCSTSNFFRPSTISMRAFSTDTQFSFDPNFIDDDLDYEHTFDSIPLSATANSYV